MTDSGFTKFVLAILALCVFTGCPQKKDTALAPQKELTRSVPSPESESESETVDRAPAYPCQTQFHLTELHWLFPNGAHRSVRLRPNQSHTVAIPWELWHTYEQGKLKAPHWPTFRFHLHLCEKTQLSLSHEAYFENDRTDPRYSSSDFVRFQKHSKLRHYAIAPDLLGLPALQNTRGWQHEFTFRLGEIPAQTIGLSFQVEHKPIPHRASFRHNIGGKWGVTPSSAKSLAIRARRADLKTKQGVATFQVRIPKPYAPECAVFAEGDYFYSRPYQKLKETHSDNVFYYYELPLNTQTLGSLAFIASKETKYELRCRIRGHYFKSAFHFEFED